MSSALKRYTQKHMIKDNRILKHSHANQPRSRQGSVITKNKQKTIPSDEETISYMEDKISHNYISRRRMNSLPVSLPRLEEKIVEQQKKAINDIYRKKKSDSKNRYDLLPMSKFKPIRLMKRPSSSNSQVSYLSLASSRAKLTDQYFSQLDNIRIVQRLLLARPTKQTSKNEHHQFFKQQNKYKKNIQISKSQPSKNRKLHLLNKPWNM